MKLTLKTLQRDTFELELDENLTVLDLKKKVEEVRGAGYAAQNLKLIYAGKILSDEKVIKEYDITAFIVVMVSKPKPAPVPAPSTEQSSSAAATPAPTPATTTTTTTTEAAAPAATEPVTPAAPTPTPTTTPAATQQQPTEAVDNMFVSGSEYEAAVTEMINMGFERTQIERAMTASFMNPHRAIEYLFNPTTMPAVPAAQPAAPPAAGGGTTPAAVTPATPPAAGGDATAPAAGNLGNLDFLRNQPQLQMLRQLIAQDPQMLQSVLEELGQANPQLLQAIQANPQQFINLLHEGGGGGDTAAAPQPPPPGTVQITPAEKAAIDRIKALGFPEHLVVQAYFACEKNENLAAEFLFSENLEDDNS